MPEEQTPAIKQSIELATIQSRIKTIQNELPVLKKLEKSMLEYNKLSKK
jgi:hypothetical protein